MQALQVAGQRLDLAVGQLLADLLHDLEVGRLLQGGAVYKKIDRLAVCDECGRPGFQSQQCELCGGNLSVNEREGYYLRVKSCDSDMFESVGKGGLVLPPSQQQYVLDSIRTMPAADVFIGLRAQGTRQDIVSSEWFNSLSIILSICGYPGDEGGFQKLWANTYIFILPEQINHICYWFSVLSALQLPLPGKFVCHGAHKILDRRLEEVSPLLLAQNYGQETIRYFLLAVKNTPGSKNIYYEDQVVQRINHDLANDLGNLVVRIVSMVSQYVGEMVPRPNILTRQSTDLELREQALAAPGKVEKHINSQELPLAIQTIKNLISITNKFIASTNPAQLATQHNQQERLNTVLYNICEALRFIAIMLKPILPETAQSILAQLGLDSVLGLDSWDSLGQWGLLPVGTKVFPQPNLFPRIFPGLGSVERDLILREELGRIKMVVARILSAAVVPDYEALLQLVLYDGRQRYSVLAPVARSHSATDLEGKKVVLLSNLRSIEVDGIISEGEVLVLETGTGRLRLVHVDDDVPEGSKVLCLS